MGTTTDVLKEIYAGWKNYIFENPAVEAEAKRRMEICVNCKYLSKFKSCSKCGCFMPAKVKSPLSWCIIKKW